MKWPKQALICLLGISCGIAISSNGWAQSGPTAAGSIPTGPVTSPALDSPLPPTSPPASNITSSTPPASGPSSAASPSNQDNWIFSQGSPSWLFLAGPLNSTSELVRLESSTKAGQFGLVCTKDGTFNLIVFPFFGSVKRPKPGESVTAKVEIDGATKSLTMLGIGGTRSGYIAAGRAIPAIALAMAGVPDSRAADMAITVDGMSIRTLLPSPRSLAGVTSQMCTQWYDAILTSIVSPPPVPLTGQSTGP